MLCQVLNSFAIQEDIFYNMTVLADFWSNNNIEHKSNRNRNKTLSVKKHLTKIRPYLKW